MARVVEALHDEVRQVDQETSASTELGETLGAVRVGLDLTPNVHGHVTAQVSMAEDDDYLLEIKRAWNESIVQAFRALPHFDWSALPDRPRFE